MSTFLNNFFPADTAAMDPIFFSPSNGIPSESKLATYMNRQNVAPTSGYGLNNGNVNVNVNVNSNGNGFSLLNLDSSLAVNKKSQVTPQSPEFIPTRINSSPNFYPPYHMNNGLNGVNGLTAAAAAAAAVATVAAPATTATVAAASAAAGAASAAVSASASTVSISKSSNGSGSSAAMLSMQKTSVVATVNIAQQQQQQQQQQQAEKLDNISRVKSLLGPLRESMFLTIRSSAFTLQQNNLADNLKRDTGGHGHVPRFDKHLEDFYACCDQMELHLKTAIQCMQQLTSSQHYLPGAVTAMRMENFMQDNPAGPIPYPTYLNTVRVHVQSAKDIHDTLISAAQNISQAD